MRHLKKKSVLLVTALLVILLLAGCGQEEAPEQEPPKTDPAPQSDSSEVQGGDTEPLFSYEGTVFRYGDQSWDLSERVPAATSILSAQAVGDRILVECHCGPKNGAYCVFDPAAGRFEEDRYGNHLIWQREDLDTAVYDFWSEVRAYDGSVLADYDLPEDEYIYNLAFSEDGTQVRVTIVKDDGTERTEVIDLPRA